jgi:hypothetical protein
MIARSASPSSLWSSTTLRLLVLQWTNNPGSYRRLSPPGISIYTTSAPRSASTLPHQLAASPVQSSTTRMYSAPVAWRTPPFRIGRHMLDR